MSEKPQKRMVNKGRQRQMLEGVSTLLLIFGVVGLICTVVFTISLFCYDCQTPGWCYLFVAFLLSLPSLLLLWSGKRVHSKASQITVSIIDAHLLPLQETLVRGSEEPPVAQSDILLRASLTEPETPPEQLLRPTVEE